MKRRLLSLFAQVLFVSLLMGSITKTNAQQPYRAVVFSPSGGLTIEARYLAMTLAGIVNRDSARLYLRNVYENWAYNQTDEQFEALYKSRGNVVFEEITTVAALVNRFRPFINGAITYDLSKIIANHPTEKVHWQAEYAGTLGGLTNRLPCTPDMATTLGLSVNNTVVVSDAFDGDSPVTVSGRIEAGNAWNNASASNDVNYRTLLTWAVTTILPRCNPKKYYCRALCDLTVQHRMFQTNLSGPDDLDFSQLASWKTDILESILTYLHSKNYNGLFRIYGWVWPEPIVQWFASFGATFQPVLLGNLSFHGTFPVPASTYNRPSLVQDYASVVLDRSKHYVVVIGTEGDSGNWCIGFQSGAWLSAKRGTVPVTWGLNLTLMDDCPFVANYYMETATANDGFMAVLSPLGYTYTDMIPAESRAAAVAESQRLMSKFKVNDIYAYKHYAPTTSFSFRGVPLSNNYNMTKLSRFNRDAGVPGATYLFEQTLPFQVPYTSPESQLFFNQARVGDTNPTFYGTTSSNQGMADRILGLLRPRTTPSFLIGGYQRLRQDDFANRISPGNADMSLAMLEDVIRRVKADPAIGSKVEFVTIEKMTGLMRRFQGLTPAPQPARAFETLWERTARTNTTPAWLSTRNNTERGIAYSNEVLYVVSRSAQTTVRMLNWRTGADVGQLSTTGISGGTFDLNDVETSWDGKILAANLTANAQQSAFKVYFWNANGAAPTLAISYTGAALRLGDGLSVIGSVAARTAIVVAAASQSNKIFRWSMNADGTFNQTPTVITVQGRTSLGTLTEATPLGLGSEGYLLSGYGIQPIQVSAAGVVVATAPPTVVTMQNGAITAWATTNRWVGLFESKPTGLTNQALLFKSGAAGLGSTTVGDVYGATPSLGSNPNLNRTGDICYRADANGNYVFFVLGTNNGIGAYWAKSGTDIHRGLPLSAVNAREAAPEAQTELVDGYDLSTNIPNPFSTISVVQFSIPTATTVDITLLDAAGRRVKTLHGGFTPAGTHTVEVDGTLLPSGTYLCTMQADGFQKTIRMIRN